MWHFGHTNYRRLLAVKQLLWYACWQQSKQSEGVSAVVTERMRSPQTNCSAVAFEHCKHSADSSGAYSSAGISSSVPISWLVATVLILLMLLFVVLAFS